MASEIPAVVHLIGAGIAIPTHTDSWSIAHIERADIVFHLLAGPVEQEWLRRVRPDARSLLGHYTSGRSRARIYRDMVDEIEAVALPGTSVAVLQYGHSCIGSTVSRMLLERGLDTDSSNLVVRAWAGISSVDCLFADIGFDPATEGVLLADATLAVRGQVRLSSGLSAVLLQPAFTCDGDMPFPGADFSLSRERVFGLLASSHTSRHPVLLYEAATHLSMAPRMDWTVIEAASSQPLAMATTIFVPSESWAAARLRPHRD